jgi:hypothetical protein
LENREFVDQKNDQKVEEIKRWIEAHRDLLSRQGTVVESYRNYRGRKLGPYYKLAYRDRDGRQRALYLGTSAELAQQVRALLRKCQAGMHEQRKMHQLRKVAREKLKEAKKVLSDELADRGLRLQGYEVRGWRGLSNGGADGNEPTGDATASGGASESDKH